MLAQHPGSTKRRRRRRQVVGASGNGRKRFYVVAGLLTAGVTLLLVPQVTHLIESLLAYDPLFYDPRDIARTNWMPFKSLSDMLQGTEGFLTVAFLGLCAFFFMMSRKD